jgi:hypothetical protein
VRQVRIFGRVSGPVIGCLVPFESILMGGIMNVKPWRRSALGLVTVGLVGGLGLLGPGASARETPSSDKVFLIQGTPGVSASISLDGRVVAQDAQAKDIIGPLTVTPGRHSAMFSGKGWTVRALFKVSRASTDLVLHLPADPSAKPIITVYNNDIHPIAAGKGRLVIAHTAVVPPADVRVNGKLLFSNIANGEFVSAEVPAKTYSAEIVPTGQRKPLFGPVDISVKAGALTRVFAIGQPTNGGMDAIVQVLPLASSGSSRPRQVDTGSAGLVAAPAVSSRPLGNGWTLFAGSAALLLVVVLRRRFVR